MVEEIPEGLEKILVITNRADRSGDNERLLFPNELDSFRRVSYLWAACRQGKWMLAPVGDFRKGMEGVDRGGDILFFVHGNGKSMPLALTRARQLREQYDVSMVLFDWPSYNSNFNKSLSRVRLCGENFYNHLLLFQEYRREVMAPGQHLNMAMHSLGAYFLSHMVVNGNNQYLDELIFDNILLNAAAIRSREHGEVLSRVRIAERIYVASNYNDRVLRGAHLLTSGHMLGNVFMEPRSDKLIYVDFTPVARKEHTYFAGYHGFEFTEPSIGEFYQAVIRGDAPKLDASEHFRRLPGTRVYEAIPLGE